MGLQRSTDDDQPLWPTPMQRLAGDEERRRGHADVVAVGSMVCPACDAPVSPGGAIGPAQTVACPWCERRGAAREFLVLGAPTRPARVVVRVRRGGLRIADRPDAAGGAT